MAEDHGVMPLSPEAFQQVFAEVQPLILAEWPQLDVAALAATNGDVERVVTLIAVHTGHTRTLVRRHIAELYAVVTQPPRRAKQPASGGAAGGSHVDDLLEMLEKKTADLARELRSSLLNSARGTARENPLMTLLIVLGIGFILGVLFGGRGRG